MTTLLTAIPAATNPTQYHHAVYLRILAEESCAPDAYERAAHALDAAGMPNAAAACLNRAEQYRKEDEK